MADNIIRATERKPVTLIRFKKQMLNGWMDASKKATKQPDN
jgi:hypothetical protein